MEWTDQIKSNLDWKIKILKKVCWSILWKTIAYRSRICLELLHKMKSNKSLILQISHHKIHPQPSQSIIFKSFCIHLLARAFLQSSWLRVWSPPLSMLNMASLLSKKPYWGPWVPLPSCLSVEWGGAVQPPLRGAEEGIHREHITWLHSSYLWWIQSILSLYFSWSTDSQLISRCAHHLLPIIH